MNGLPATCVALVTLCRVDALAAPQSPPPPPPPSLAGLLRPAHLAFCFCGVSAPLSFPLAARTLACC